MIIGIGTDIVSIRRIETILNERKDQFLSRAFSEEEIKDISESLKPAATCAKRFAAKEAYAKARGSGFRDGFSLSQVSVSHDEFGKPILKLSEKEQLTMAGVHAYVSLSDDGEYAIAYVILERHA